MGAITFVESFLRKGRFVDMSGRCVYPRRTMTRRWTKTFVVSAFGLGLGSSVALSGCSDSAKTDAVKTDGKTDSKVASKPANEGAKPSGTTAEAASKPIQANKRTHDLCVGPIGPSGAVKSFKMGERDWELNGSTLTEKSHDGDDSMTVGLLADLKEDTPENLANIDRFVAYFKQERAEFVFIDGDTGIEKAQIANNLKRVAQSGIPTGILIGNRECTSEFNEAVEEVAAKLQNVVNLNRVRHIVADDAEFVTLPGYYNPAYLHCTKDPCQYYEEDVQALAPIVDKAAEKSAKALAIISHGPPRQKSPTGIDRIGEGTNEGDPMLAKFMSEHRVPFGFFANIHEAGGHAVDLEGDSLVKENILSESFYLNPGPADSVRWAMNDSTESVGMAAVITFKGKQASYKLLRLNAKKKK